MARARIGLLVGVAFLVNCEPPEAPGQRVAALTVDAGVALPGSPAQDVVDSLRARFQITVREPELVSVPGPTHKESVIPPAQASSFETSGVELVPRFPRHPRHAQDARGAVA